MLLLTSHFSLSHLQSPTTTFSSDTKEKFQLLNQATDDMAIAVKSSLELVSDKEAEIALVSEQLAEHEEKLMEAVGVNKKLQDQFDRIEEQDLLPDQLQTIAMLQKQIESLEDQVIDRDAALQEIESQMKQDYEQHDQLISKLKFQVSTYTCTVRDPALSIIASVVFFRSVHIRVQLGTLHCLS